MTRIPAGASTRIAAELERSLRSSLAVAIATPLAVSAITRLQTAETHPIYAMQQAAASPTDTLKEGIRLYKNAEYEESLATLQSVNADALSAADKQTLYQTLGQADSAAAGRKQRARNSSLGRSRSTPNARAKR